MFHYVSNEFRFAPPFRLQLGTRERRKERKRTREREKERRERERERKKERKITDRTREREDKQEREREKEEILGVVSHQLFKVNMQQFKYPRERYLTWRKAQLSE